MLAFLEIAFAKVGIFGIIFCNLQTKPVISKKKFVFVPPSCGPNFMVITSEKADAITRKSPRGETKLIYILISQ